jgi:hypothetical protein
MSDDSDQPPPPPPSDASMTMPPMDGGPVMGTGCAGGGKGCVAVPPGWSLVAFAPSQSSPCPTGFDMAAATDLVEGPTAAGACGCGACSVTTAPNCASGTIGVTFDYDTTVYAGTCYMAATPATLSNSPPGSCLTDIYNGDYSTYDAKYTSPAPSGGVCSAPAVNNAGALTYAARDRACTPDSDAAAGCSGDQCQPALSGAYQACIASPGSVTCPPGPLAVAHHVGTSATATCEACPCTISGTCTGTMTLFTDVNCKKGATSVPANTCEFVGTGNYKAYEYAGGNPKNVACKAGAAPAPAIALDSEATICCAGPAAMN